MGKSSRYFKKKAAKVVQKKKEEPLFNLNRISLVKVVKLVNDGIRGIKKYAKS